MRVRLCRSEVGSADVGGVGGVGGVGDVGDVVCAGAGRADSCGSQPVAPTSAGYGFLLSVPTVVAELSFCIGRLESSGLPLDGLVLRQLRAQMGRLDAEVCIGEIEFDQAEGYRDLGNTSLRGFMIDACGLARPDATRLARRAERLESWPDVVGAWRCGRLTGAQVEAIVTAIPSRFVRLFAEQADGVVNAIAPLNIEATAVALRQWVNMAESADGPQDFTERRSGLHIDTMLDGTQALSGHFTQSAGPFFVQRCMTSLFPTRSMPMVMSSANRAPCRSVLPTR